MPLTPERLAERYGSHGGFAAEWVRATNAALRAGFLLREDAHDIRVVGVRSDVLT